MPFFSLQGYPINAYTPRCLQYMVIQKYQWCTLVPLWMVEQKSYQNKKKKMVTIPTSKNESCKKLNINCHSIFAAFVLLLFYKWDKNTFFRGKKVTVKVKKSLAKEDCALQGVQFENYHKCKSYSTEMGHFWPSVVRAKMPAALQYHLQCYLQY